MERRIINTADGSVTVEIPELKVTYHSRHGAIQESMHVFIETGLKYWLSETGSNKISILEMGFGTGLNAFLTWIQAKEKSISIKYTALEKYPLINEQYNSLNYADELGHQPLFEQLHAAPWKGEVPVEESFILHKIQLGLEEYTSNEKFDLIYYDAFAPAAQPELWTAEIFSKLHSLLNDGGILVTYCSKSIVRKAMEAAGFKVTKPPGPLGKREMVRAFKN